MANRLAGETSPYLLQHKDNPVDWFPWGDEALARARTEDRPILLSVGYSACHWCHVMEHESFANAETAALMNEKFVNIKVDREERPDIDSLYMQAVQQMTGQGGWPMTVFLAPDGSAFYGGTYFPPEPRHGLPSFRQILTAISDAYENRRPEVDESASTLRRALRQGMSVNPPPAAIDASLLHRAFQGLGRRFDEHLGGFGGAPKFPQPMILDFLLLYWARTGNADALKMVERTLEAMATGGIYDHLGGGFHRYSVDARWLVPHFEKMLYDNALLARTYLRAYQATGRTDFRATAEDVLRYVTREMLDESGGFYSSQDADSEGVEGKFYVWSAEEIDDVLGDEDGPLFRRYYDVSDTGNWEGENILNVGASVAEVAREAGVSEARLAAVLEAGRERLYEVRSERVWPGRDDKVLLAWNAMMLHAFADAARILGSDAYRSIAARNADFLLTRMRSESRLLRSWRDGSARIDAFLEDHGLLVDALLALYEATFDLRWVRDASWVADRMIERFWSEDEGIFYDTAVDAESLVIRPRDIYDNATPSGTSAAASALQRLARLTSDADYERIATRILESMADIATQVPQGFGHLLGAITRHLAPPMEIVISGSATGHDTKGFVEHLSGRFLPFTTIALRPTEAPGEAESLMPLLAEREAIEGAATAYLCRHYTCRRPVTTVAELENELRLVLDEDAIASRG